MSYFLFGLDGLVTLATVWLVLRRAETAESDITAQVVAGGLVGVMVVSGAGVALGAVGILGASGFLVVHAVLLAGLLVWQRPRWASEIAVGRERWRLIRCALASDRVAAGLVLLLLLVVGVMGVLAALAQPVVYDALAYRLPRMGAWLQSGWVGPLLTDDPRLNYMPVVPDLTMVWLLGATREGYRLVALASWCGGCLMLGATYGLARLSGMGRRAAGGTLFLLLGMANVVPQFTTAHTDLFTAGIFTAAFYLWLLALRRGRGTWLGGLGAALALGSKGTVIYLAPGALIWVAWAAWRHPVPVRAWAQTALAAGLGLCVWVVPGYLQNWRVYGSVLGPPAYVAQHHAGPFLQKLPLNLRSSLVQSFDPNSQPPGLGLLTRPVGQMLATMEPDEDVLVWEHMRRRSTLLAIMQRATPDADVTAFGLVPLGLFAAGLGTALWRRRESGAPTALVWAAGVLVFGLFLHGMQRWHPFGFRYLVLAAPWMALTSTWAITRWRPVGQALAWVLIAGTSAGVLWWQNTQAMQAGWRAVSAPEHTRNYHTYVAWRRWFDDLGAQEPIRVALPVNRPLAAFFRNGNQAAIELAQCSATTAATAEAMVSAGRGWTVVPAAQFLGREGAVAGRTWLEDGDENSPFSLAAYRRLAPGERPSTLVYRQRCTVSGERVGWSLLVKAGDDGICHLQLRHPGATAVDFVVATPSGLRTGVLPGDDTPLELELPLPVRQVAEIRVDLNGVPTGEKPTVRVLVNRAPPRTP